MKSETKKKTTKSGKGNKIVPLQDRILLKPFTKNEFEEANSSGIIIPDTIDKDKPEQGKVIAVGLGKYIDGKLVPMNIKVGDVVIFSKYGYDEVKIDGEELYILKEDNILAIIKQ